jgi:Kef-type K+ transport system membrane component KefB
MDPVARLALALAVLLAASQGGAALARRLGLPSVLGELGAGMALAASPIGGAVLGPEVAPALDTLGELGVLLLMFEAGLSLHLREMLAVGRSATAVAVTGTIASFASVWGALGLAGVRSPSMRLVLAGASTATSVGISARVLGELGAAATREASTVLGAAVIDDVLGLVVLAVALAARGAGAHSGATDAMALARVLLAALGFFAVALLLLPRALPTLLRWVLARAGERALLVSALIVCFAASWLATRFGLAAMLGAFAAGLAMDEPIGPSTGPRPLGQQLEPLGAMLVPLFFAMLGAHTEVRALLAPTGWAWSFALLAGAIVGKMACAAAAPRATERWAVAFGMMPRGEVSLVFASYVASLGGDGGRARSAIVLMVIVTSVVGPLGLARAMRGAHAPLRSTESDGAVERAGRDGR